MRIALVSLGVSVLLAGATILYASSPGVGWGLVVVGFAIIGVAFLRRTPPEKLHVVLPDPDVTLRADRSLFHADRPAPGESPFQLENIGGGGVAKAIHIAPLRILGASFAFDEIRLLEANGGPHRVRYSVLEHGNDVEGDFGVNWFAASMLAAVQQKGHSVTVPIDVSYSLSDGTRRGVRFRLRCNTDKTLTVLDA